ncbi:MAG: thioredoxin family protein [Candidatus Cloacimonetes bacterium]|nr:thioredoxin family protein [Candidatus Cloacimonadota bacterium]MDY0299495.1 thioredoxin family protein [Candidatus Cloacimonadaceae bacterium]MCB5279365.1 thioredoxin family protein [Candidatus Cloacimonadota bacterium]MCK9332894.1 thioredoxin family protein [Candidatus Cloacimonadota bacterium]MDD2210701.1 thioredoxin family protein [Candidatus Cloacimonadota bacterium]
MRYILILIIASMTAVLGCTPAPKQEPVVEESPVVETTQSEKEYEAGTWIDNWELAISYARQSGKKVLVNFTGSDWCGWCVRLSSEVFTQDAFKEYAQENLILLKLDFPRNIDQSSELKKQNQYLQRQFGIQGYPTILLVDEEGKEIARTGYQPGGAQNYVKHLQELQQSK